MASDQPAIKRRQMLLRWHRRLGLFSCLFIFLLAISGILINHSNALGLDQSMIHSDWILDAYGLKAPENILHYSEGEIHISQLDDQVFWNDQFLTKIEGQLAGTLERDGLIYLASSSILFIHQKSGELVEKLDTNSGIPIPIEGIGIDTQEQLCLSSRDKAFRTDESMFEWEDIESNQVQWSTSTPCPKTIAQKTRSAYRKQLLSVERFLLDLHSGRFLGSYGPFLMDLAAIALILLSLSGLWLWPKIKPLPS